MSRTKVSITKKDLTVTYFSGSGAGGQHRNKHQNCVRIKHNETGIIVTGQSHKERLSNTKEALNNLVNHPRIKQWLAFKHNLEEKGITVETHIQELMKEENLLIEVKDDKGKWIKKEDNK